MRPLVPVLLVMALAGCGREDGEPTVPAVCKEPAPLTAALDSAPAPVEADGVAISDCLERYSSVDDVQLVGAALLETAQRLGEKGDALALGYLVGAMRRDPNHRHGFYAEAIRRVEQEARPLRRSATFGRGLRAGRTSG